MANHPRHAVPYVHGSIPSSRQLLFLPQQTLSPFLRILAVYGDLNYKVTGAVMQLVRGCQGVKGPVKHLPLPMQINLHFP